MNISYSGKAKNVRKYIDGLIRRHGERTSMRQVIQQESRRFDK